MNEIGCAACCEAVSALVDGEEAPFDRALVDAHLRRCPSCARFSAELPGLAGRLRLLPTEPVPDVVPQVLAGAKEGGLARAARWGVPAAAVCAALPALFLGAFTHPHVTPSHIVTPCTHAVVFLVHRFPPR